MSKHPALEALCNAGLFNDIDGDIDAEIGVFMLMNIPMDSVGLSRLADSANESAGKKIKLPDIDFAQLSAYSGWGIYHFRNDGAEYWHEFGDDELEALESYKAMGATYATELGL